MASRREIRRMMRLGITCGDFARQCDMRTEYRAIYHSPDGKVFRVHRQGCRNCGQQTMSATDVTVVVTGPPWLTYNAGRSDVEVYEDGEPWEEC